jgi:hypothetical protein
LIAVGFLEYEQAQAKSRMIVGGKVKGKENFPDPIDRGQSRDKAGERMGVSGRSVSDEA